MIITTDDSISWKTKYGKGSHEANFLKLDYFKVKRTFGWKPHWKAGTNMDKIAEWSKVYSHGGHISKCMEKQIKEFYR